MVYWIHEQAEHRQTGRGDFGTGGRLLHSLYRSHDGRCKRKTILRLLAEVGQACANYQDRVIRNVPARRVQVDEIWSYVGCKEKNSRWKSLMRKFAVTFGRLRPSRLKRN